MHVKNALCDLPAVTYAEVFLGAEKAIVKHEGDENLIEAIKKAVEQAGYEAYLASEHNQENIKNTDISFFGKQSIITFIGMVITILVITLAGEQMGLIARLESIIPWYVWLLAIAVLGFPVLKQVMTALIKRRIISHTLMTASMLTAVVVGRWATAMLVILFMRLGDFIEKSTTEKARQAVRKLKQAAPQFAHKIIHGVETNVPVSELHSGDVIQVKPGESIPVDGKIIDGKAIVDQSAISGESMPIEKMEGDTVHAASIIRSGSLRVSTTAAGKDSLFGRIISMVEEAEANRGEIQRIADRFSSIYLPIVAFIALVTYLASGNAIAAAAVMAVSCSCSFSLATPVAMLASIGTAAQQGLLFKGGKYIEGLAQIDTIYIDKTGTLTLGQPTITGMRSMRGYNEMEILQYAASVEQYSEHPLANAILRLAEKEEITPLPVQDFESEIGRGVSGRVNDVNVLISNNPLRSDKSQTRISETMRKQGKTLMYVHIDGEVAGILGAEDIIRPDAKQALEAIKHISSDHIVLISGDHTAAVKPIADQLGIAFEAEMLPHEKIAMVMRSQKEGRRVMMIGDGINDAPALAQADIGVAMGASGTDIAIETAHIVLLREDWGLIPQAFQIAEHTMRIVRINIFLTAIYNLAGITLAAFGLLAPVVAAAMQSIPDVGIMANSARLLKKKSID